MHYTKEIMSGEFTKHLLTFDGGFHAVLHHFTDVDKGGPHDHPWSFITHVLSGGYIEKIYRIEDLNKWRSEVVFRQPGKAYKVEAGCIHEIIGLPEGECWTAVIPKPAERKSAFYQFTDKGILRRHWDEEEFKPLF